MQEESIEYMAGPLGTNVQRDIGVQVHTSLEVATYLDKLGKTAYSIHQK